MRTATQMNLYLVQHGTAVEKTINPDRPLSPAGIADVKRVASTVAAAGIVPKRILHSGKTRAMETATLFSECLSAITPPTAVEGIAPTDSAEEFAAQAAAWHEDVLICGHQPFMGRLVSHLLCGRAGVTTVEFVPGAIAALSRDGTGLWQLCWLVRPQICPRK